MLVIILYDKKTIPYLRIIQIRRNIKITFRNVLVPVHQLLYIVLRISSCHALMYNFQGRFHPDNYKINIFLTWFIFQIRDMLTFTMTYAFPLTITVNTLKAAILCTQNVNGIIPVLFKLTLALLCLKNVCT